MLQGEKAEVSAGPQSAGASRCARGGEGWAGRRGWAVCPTCVCSMGPERAGMRGGVYGKRQREEGPRWRGWRRGTAARVGAGVLKREKELQCACGVEDTRAPHAVSEAACASQPESECVQNYSRGGGQREGAKAERARSWAAVCVGQQGARRGRRREQEGRLRDGRWWNVRAPPSPVTWGGGPRPVRLRADPLWLCLSAPPPNHDPFLLLHSPLLPDTHTVWCQLPPPARCECPA